MYIYGSGEGVWCIWQRLEEALMYMEGKWEGFCDDERDDFMIVWFREDGMVKGDT